MGCFYNVLIRVLRRDCNPKTMTSLFGVQTVFKTISKHYKSAVNSFQERVLVIPERDRDVLYTRRVRHSKSVTNCRRQTRFI